MGLRDEPGYPDLPTFEGTPTREYFEKWHTFLEGILERYGNVIIAKLKSAMVESQKLDEAVLRAEEKRLELTSLRTSLQRNIADADAARVALENKIAEYNQLVNPAPPRGDV